MTATGSALSEGLDSHLLLVDSNMRASKIGIARLLERARQCRICPRAHAELLFMSMPRLAQVHLTWVPSSATPRMVGGLIKRMTISLS
ncbi:hypothetical protein BDV93DRAFT_258727 [Ceratobasidium sp. AG-I]|nr:hypothetical protein BDV93DRAFT_258727 [Ceratobasidium sp. AG-I]